MVGSRIETENAQSETVLAFRFSVATARVATRLGQDGNHFILKRDRSRRYETRHHNRHAHLFLAKRDDNFRAAFLQRTHNPALIDDCDTRIDNLIGNRGGDIQL